LGDWLAMLVEERVGTMTPQQDAEQQYLHGSENRGPRNGVWPIGRCCRTEQTFVLDVEGTIHHAYEGHPGTT
jgi:hypothetical protein